MGNNSSKRKVKYDKNVKHAMDREVDFAQRFAYDRQLFNNNSSYANVLNAKGSFLLSVYAKLTSSSIHLYKISRRIFLQQPTQREPTRRILAVETQRELEKDLDRGTAAWNNADSAAQWLLHDYDVSFRTVMLPDQKEGDLEGRRREHDRLVGETKRLKMEAMQVGFKYLDRNNSGYLEPSDIPNLPAQVYARLDTTGKQSPSWNDVQRAMDNMENNVYRLRDEIARLADNLNQPRSINYNNEKEQYKQDVDMLNTRERYNRALIDCNTEERALNDIYELFRQAFIANVFDVIPGHADALPELSQVVRETHHVDRVEPSKTTEPWMSRIGSDILQSGSQNPVVLQTAAPDIPQKDKSILKIPVAHSDSSVCCVSATFDQENTTPSSINPQVAPQVTTIIKERVEAEIPASNFENLNIGSNNRSGSLSSSPASSYRSGSLSSSSSPENRYRAPMPAAYGFPGNTNGDDNFGNSNFGNSGTQINSGTQNPASFTTKQEPVKTTTTIAAATQKIEPRGQGTFENTRNVQNI